jgi:DNA polymerase III delta prime subunit
MDEIQLKNILWQEKYRPQKVEEVISDSKEKVKKYLENPHNIPNFLFVSRTPGTGKTTMAKAIINELNCNFLILNSSDERGVDTIREKVKDFAKTQSSNGVRKCVFLDESDGLTPIAQQSLRNLMETYSKNVFYILTCNYENKIIEPLVNRCVKIEFNKPKKEDIKKYLIKICENEKLEFEEDGLNKLIDVCYPSIRGMVNILQDLKSQDKKVISDNITLKDEQFIKLWKDIKELKFSQVWEFIKSGGVDVEVFNKWLFYEIGKDDSLDLVKKMKLLRVLAENERTMRFGDSIIIFSGNLVEIISILK